MENFPDKPSVEPVLAELPKVTQTANGSQVLPRHSHKSSIFRTIKAVAWSFVGLRSHGDYEKDIQALNPLVIVAVGIAGVFVFVGFLIVLVNWVVP